MRAEAKLTDDETWQLLASKSGRLVLERYRAVIASGSSLERQAIVDAVRDRARRRATPGLTVRYAAILPTTGGSME